MAALTRSHHGTTSEASNAAAAVERLRRAEAQLSRRRQSDCGPGETDRSAMRYLLEETDAGRQVTPTDLAAHLSITTVSVTTLLDRLGHGSMIHVRPHPTDRRKKLVTPVDRTDDPDLLDPLTAIIRDLSADLESAEAQLIVRYLDQISDAVGRECAG